MPESLTFVLFTWRIGTGESIRIWRDPWIPGKMTFRPVSRVRPCRLKWVAQLMDSERGRWNEDVLNRFFRPVDVDEIMKLKPTGRREDDIAAWFYEKSGLFSVWSAWRCSSKALVQGKHRLHQLRGMGGRPLWKEFWRIKVPHKVRIFGWKFINKGLATRRNKFVRRLEQIWNTPNMWDGGGN